LVWRRKFVLCFLFRHFKTFPFLRMNISLLDIFFKVNFLLSSKIDFHFPSEVLCWLLKN
jgi:hypothetical protein